MKLVKKFSTVLLSLCLLLSCFSMVAYAADGRISFTDPSTAVGEYVEVKCVLRSTSGNMGAIEVNLTYDGAYLRFDSGSGIESAGDGALKCSGTGNSAEVSFVAKFQALQEGTTKVEISSASVADENGAVLTLDQGSSAVTIAAGDPSKIEENSNETTSSAADVEVDVNGVVYTLTDDFADADIPTGYARTQRNLDGVDRQMVENENGTVCLAYMTDAEGTGDFFLYHEESGAFSPYAEISISDTTSIIVLSDVSEVSLPGNYKEAKLSLNGKEFPVWQDTDKEGMYLFYAVNSNGETTFYQYDSLEGTYQKIEIVADSMDEELEETPSEASSPLGKIMNLLKSYFSYVIIGVGVLGILALILIIVLAVKLHNRNAEIDELYDEYGIDLEEESADMKQEVKKEAKKKKVHEDLEEEFEDFEEFDEPQYNEEDFETTEFGALDFSETEYEEDLEEEFEDFEEEEFEEFKESRYAEPSEGEFTGYTDRMDFTIDDLDELLEEKATKKAGHMEDDDTFKMDFIDLD